MITVDLPTPAHGIPSAVARAVEHACAAEGLTLTLKGTLARYPGCTHWHFKKGREAGTLEITWWAREGRLGCKVSAGRRGGWTAAALERLERRLAAR